MNQNDYLALAAECLRNAQQCQDNGDTDRAAWWRRNAAAMKKSAQQAEPWWTSLEEQESQHDKNKC